MTGMPMVDMPKALMPCRHVTPVSCAPYSDEVQALEKQVEDQVKSMAKPYVQYVRHAQYI